MKIAYLSGAYKNSGDFLIEKRAVELLMHEYPACEFIRIMRNEVEKHIAEVNACDLAVIGGGPIYQTSLVNYMPLETYRNEVEVPTMILGGGWYGKSGSSYEMLRYRFDQQTKRFLEKVYESGFGFSCRDIHTANVLKANGFPKVVLTGCPAWYDLRYVGKTEFRRNIDSIRTIAVSDPARVYNLDASLEVVKYLKKRFKDAEIRFLFHRGINLDQHTSGKSAAKLNEVARSLRDMGVDYRDISYGVDGFSQYDQCDLHVGFRVHAHIYNMGIRNRSILIEEDDRGAGVNETLGLPSIRAYDDGLVLSNRLANKALRSVSNRSNRNLINELDTYLNILLSNDFCYLKNAFAIQENLYRGMKEYMGQISEKADDRTGQG